MKHDAAIVRSFRTWCLLAFLAPLLARGDGLAAPAKPWQKLENCRLLPNRWNDGDSFHVAWEGQEFLFRLYFVDAPEADAKYPDRVAEQAAYFGLTPLRTRTIGNDASAFVQRLLRAKPFTVWTRWRDALGRSQKQRFYALVFVEGNDLNEVLVREGLVRIYGTRVPLPDGRSSRVYLEKLGQLETEAKKAGRSGWATTPAP